MRCFHLQFFFALVPSGEFRASGREFLCPRRQRNQNAAEPTVRTPFSRLLRQLTLSGEAPEPLRAPLARLAECYSPPAGPPCRTPCRTAAGRRGTLPLNFCGTSFFSTFVERIVDVVGFTGASSGEKRRLKPPERRLPTQLSTEGAKPCWSSPRRGRRGPHLPHGQTAEAPPPGGMDHLPSPSQTMYPRGAPPYLSTMPRRCRPPACR